jgi:hypothetical protein
MREVHQLLDRRPQVDPPGNLREGIATEIRRLSPRPVEAPLSGLASASRRHRRVMRVTFAAAAVLALAVLLVPALVHQNDSDQMRGTIAAPSPADGKEVILLAGNGIEGAVFAAWEGADLVLRPELRSRGPARLEVGFDPAQLSVVSAGDSTGRSNGESGLITATLDSSPFEIRLRRRSGDPVSLSLKISTGESMVSTEVRFESSTNFFHGRL